MWRVQDLPADAGGLVARLTLVVTPLLAFKVVPLGGAALAGMALPLAILVFFYVKTPGARVPGWEAALLALLTLSLLWGDEPGYTVERLRTFLPLALATMMAAAIVPGETVLRCLKASFALIVVSSLLFFAANPEQALRVKNSGIDLRAQFDKNTYGGLLVIALLLTIEHRRRLNLLVVPGLVVLIAFNKSATAWVVAGLLVITTYASRVLIARLGSSAKPQLAVLALIGLSSALLLALNDPDSAVGAVGKSTTLSGRTYIWAACWPEVKAAPWLGHGAFTFLDSASNSPVTQAIWAQFGAYKPPHPHNGFLDLAGQLGIVGVAVFAALIARAIRRGGRAALAGVSSARTALVCLAFILIFGVTEPTYLGSWLIVTLMLVAIADPASTTTDTVTTPSTPQREAADLTFVTV